MHCYPPEDNEDAFYITGAARLVSDSAVRDAAASAFLAERSWPNPPAGFDEQEPFEFLVERALLTTTIGHGDPDPRHQVCPDVGNPVASADSGRGVAMGQSPPEATRHGRCA